MDYQEKIIKHIIAKKGATLPFVIAVCGAADIGKSHISKNIEKLLSKQGVSACHLTLDSFLMSRSKRVRKRISGYDIEAYDFESINSLLFEFHNGGDISFYPYIHATGERSKEPKTLRNSEVLIVDGLHSMNEQLSQLINYRIFVYTDDEQLRKIRREADIIKRNQSAELSNKLEPIEYIKYKQLVEPYKSQADLLIFLKEKWQYSVKEMGSSIHI